MVEKQDEMKALLLKAKEEILAGINKALKSGSETNTGEPTGDIYDQASSERDRELGLLLNDRERDKLRQIDEALLRIADGEYGICEECEEEIPLGRLKVMPFARFCVRCQSDMEKLQAQTRRVEEERSYREVSFGEEEEG
ncbi:transcriptional regulator, TraR/DksA family [Geobacter metallireducens RCH3]|uniref:Zinc finger transcriptional regulator, TraR/DksA family n=1 Tax=Geobacter metallireducens (strain ATCC 53774 / DSM 7210 / GS-15) TaxID=269799 RepID=Q39QQ7_GEOMG|nr:MULTISPECIES: TraR/DksA family transcriptional regulator [Geobacter]ABB33417.1 zinc finger transcriptional regulator, TraR/DksA family [Geobacter metallireducens GS-15]EHP87469.1 transcriptional regulator, TraR/DksA family [Geobacter metallireducens RCH3]MBT1074756.1 TraR/DksA family transcriptional regulator [Geobacter grbiciae]